MKRHACLPAHLTDDEVILWLSNNAVEKFTEKMKIYFQPDEIVEFEHESSVNGREFNRLKDIVKKVTEAVTKGNLDEPLTITIPVTLGTKVLETQRRQNDDDIERGYEETEQFVYAIPFAEGKSMEFFTEEGKHIPDRSRGMSAKEQHAHIGIFLMNNPVVAHDPVHGAVDVNTGESLEKTGTDD